MEDKRPKGAPSLFKPEYTQDLIEYFDVEPYRVVLKKIPTKQGHVVEIPMDEANDFPTLAGFAISIGVHRDTLHEWSKATDKNGELLYPHFSDAYKKAKDFQERYLLTNGLKNLINTPWGIFIAKNVLGWRDKQPDEVDVVVNNNPEMLKEMAEELRRIAKKPSED